MTETLSPRHCSKEPSVWYFAAAGVVFSALTNAHMLTDKDLKTHWRISNFWMEKKNHSPIQRRQNMMIHWFFLFPYLFYAFFQSCFEKLELIKRATMWEMKHTLSWSPVLHRILKLIKTFLLQPNKSFLCSKCLVLCKIAFLALYTKVFFYINIYLFRLFH